jgi:hypothetical protein
MTFLETYSNGATQIAETNDSSFHLWGMNLMQQNNMTASKAVTWDDETLDWQTIDSMGQTHIVKPGQSWLTRQIIAAIWILVAWAVGTIVFELGAIG